MGVRVWYQVRDLDAARAFYVGTLGFEQTETDADWLRLVRGPMEIGISEGEPNDEGGVATIDVDDVKAEAQRLRAAGVDVGVVVELHGQMRLLDVFDPDGNRVQLAQVLDESV